MRYLLPFALLLAGCAASAPGPGPVFRDCNDCPDMVVVPAGRFAMGAEAGEEGSPEGPVRNVTISRPFALGRYEITQRQFAAFIADTGYLMRGGCEIPEGGEWRRPADADWTNPGYGRVPFEDEPAACISWLDADAYVRWLADRTGLPYRLPTEAEWEYAARSGAAGEYWWGAMDAACRHANVHDEAGAAAHASGREPFPCNDGFAQAAPVGSFAANAWGLHDMSGNVWEWTADCYVAPYPSAPVDGDAVTAEACEKRAVRGGGWITGPGLQRLSFRGRYTPETLISHFGLRVARDL